MTVFIGIFSFFLILALLILVHELGHFSAAKLFGIRVDEFGLGFPPRLKSWRRGQTLYSLNAVPLGGFVRMLGENGGANDSSAFGSKPAWQRFIVLAAGPAMNIVLAVAVFFIAFTIGSPRGLPIVTSTAPHSPAQLAGLRSGDRIASVDGRVVSWADQLIDITSQHLGERVHLRVARGDHAFTVNLLARPVDGRPSNQGPLGIALNITTIVRYGAAESATRSLTSTGDMIAGLPAFFASLGQPSGGHVTGPIGIAHITTETVRQEPQYGFGLLLQLTALLSVNLGVLNLLPVPALDGGRLVFVLLSGIRRRNLNPEVEGAIHMVGMVLLLLLIVIVSYQDIARWAGGGSF